MKTLILLLSILSAAALRVTAQVAELSPCYTIPWPAEDGSPPFTCRYYCLKADNAYSWARVYQGTWTFRDFDTEGLEEPLFGICQSPQFDAIFENHVFDLGGVGDGELIAAARAVPNPEAGTVDLSYPVEPGGCYSVEMRRTGQPVWVSRGAQWFLPERRAGVRRLTFPLETDVECRVRRIR